jgi:antitoxin HigA-1
MAEYRARRNPKVQPMHPGELLREDVLPALGKKKGEIAALLGVSRQTLHDLPAEKQQVTPEMALRLGKLCGNGPTLWLNLQRAVDLWKAERRVKVERIPTLQAHLR